MDLIDVKFKNIASKYDKLKISSVKYLEKFTDNDIIDREYFIINQHWVDEQTWPYNLNDLGINNFKIIGDLTFNSNPKISSSGFYSNYYFINFRNYLIYYYLTVIVTMGSSAQI